MPLYEYKCGSCGFKFEELVGKTEVETAPCKSCGKNADRLMSRFSSSVVNSTKDTVDQAIGRAADDRWKTILDKRSERIGDKKLEPVSLPQAADGKYMPVMALGDKVDRKNKKEYVSVLHDHRKKRTEKGQTQFDGPGAF